MQSPDCDLVADANDVEIAAEDLIKILKKITKS